MGNELALPESQMIMVQVDTANKYPRVETEFVPECMKAIAAAESTSEGFARSCIYCKPVGKLSANAPVKFAVGPSVRLTEVMQPKWRNLRTGYSVTMDDERIRVRAICWDVQYNIQEYAEEECDCRGWKPYRIELKAKAMGAIAERDARLKVIGRAYADDLMAKIKDFLFRDQIEDVWKACLKAYKEFGVDKNRLLGYFQIDSFEELDEEKQKNTLFMALGIYNYLKENGIDSVDYVFGTESTKPRVSAGKKKSSQKPSKEPRIDPEPEPTPTTPRPINEEIEAVEASEQPDNAFVDFQTAVADKMREIGWVKLQLDGYMKSRFHVSKLQDLTPERRQLFLENMGASK